MKKLQIVNIMRVIHYVKYVLMAHYYPKIKRLV